MTIPEIIQAVSSVTGSYSEASFRRDCKRLRIQPLGSYRAVPRQYPNTAAAQIISSRGFETALMALPSPREAAAAVKLASLAQLKAARRAKKGGAR